MARITKPIAKPEAVAPVFERNTRQRGVIRDVFDRADRPLSIEEILALAQRGRAGVSLSTVYRFVRSLVDDDALAIVEMPGRGTFYELAGKGHHHHFSCVRCGRVYELNDCVSIDALALPNGFRADSHELTVSGVCATCGGAEAPRAGRRPRRRS